MKSRPEILDDIDAEREWWEGLGETLRLGRLGGWTYRRSAFFVLPDGRTISINNDHFPVDVAITIATRLGWKA